MKTSDVKKAAQLIEKMNEQAKQIKAVREGSMELNFGGYSVTLAPPIIEDLRNRIATTLVIEFERTKDEIIKLGVEL